MVKGVSRRVVVVQPDAHGLFEQAIFLVRDYTVPRGDVCAKRAGLQTGMWRDVPRGTNGVLRSGRSPALLQRAACLRARPGR